MGRNHKNRIIRIGAVNFGNYILLGLPFEVDYADGLDLEQTLSQVAGQQVYLVCYSFGYDGYLPSGAPLSAESSYEDIASRYLPESRAQVWECAKQCVMEVTHGNQRKRIIECFLRKLSASPF